MSAHSALSVGRERARRGAGFLSRSLSTPSLPLSLSSPPPTQQAAYTATMAFAFILAACFLIYSILLVLFRGAFVPDLRRGGGAVEMPETPGTARA